MRYGLGASCLVGPLLWSAEAVAAGGALPANHDAPMAAEPAPTAEPGTDEAADGDDGERPIEVQVLGTAPIDNPRRDPSVAAFVLRGAALDRPGASAAEALSAVPGVQSTRSGGASDLATASVRGASSAELPIYLAGVRLNDDVTGSVDLSTLPLWMLHRVEIYRGHAPVGADRLGIAGAMYFEPSLPRGTHGSAMLGGGSFGEREGRAVLSVGRRQAGALLAVRHASSRGDYRYLDDGGTRFDDSDDVVRRRLNADASELDVWTVGRAVRGPVRLTMVANALARDAGAPGLQRIAARRARARLRRWLVGLSTVVSCDGRGDPLQSGCAVQLDNSLLVSRYGLNDPLGELGPERRALAGGERFGQRLRLRARADWLDLEMGGSQEVSALRIDLERRSDIRARRQLLRSELGGTAHLGEAVDLVLLGAVECHSTQDASAGRACGVLTPVVRAGARWRVGGPVSVMANVGRYVRVPTLGELYGVSSVMRGNPALTVERGVTVDAGVSATGGAGALAAYGQLFGFARLASDLIAYQRSSFGAVRPYNAASARVLGAELAAGLRAWQQLQLSLALSWLDPRDVSPDRLVSNDLLPHHSRLLLSPGLELSSGRWALIALDTAAAGARLTYRSARVADPAGLVVLDADAQLDLDVSLSLLRRQLAARFRLANTLDERAFDVVGYPLPGRSYHLSFEVRW